MAARFTGRLVLEALDNPRGPHGRQLYRLLEPLTFHSGALPGDQLVVPAGFTTDFASIPTLAQVFIDDDHPALLKPSIAHDYLYRGAGAVAGLSRQQADRLLREGVAALGGRPWQQWAVWGAVRCFGRGSWQR